MHEIERLRDLIEERIGELDYSKNPRNLYEPISYTLNNAGKRIRPLLTLMACSMFSEKIEEALNPALGIEVFHNFTLLHDDIMDKAPVRRGKATVYKKWDENTAILSGDTMMVEAFNLIADAPDHCLRQVLKVFSEVSIGVCEGQMFDMDFETREDVTEEEYIEMIKLKTSVLIAGALKIGALIGNAKQEDADNIYHFGLNMGIAFQLLDDWLDVYSDPKVFGKKTGGDIVANKKTYLLINAINLAQGKQKKAVEEWVKADNFNEDEKIKAVKSIYGDLGIDKMVLSKAKDYSNQAFEYLERINVNEQNKLSLRRLGEELLKRIK